MYKVKQGYVLCLRDEIISPSRKGRPMAVSKADHADEINRQSAQKLLANIVKLVVDPVLQSRAANGIHTSIDVAEFADRVCLPNGINPYELLQTVTDQYPENWTFQFARGNSGIRFS